MCSENIIRRIAGTVILLSVTLSVLLHPAWLLLTLFAGINLIVSSFTSFCPIERVLGRIHVFGCTPRH